MTASEVNQAFIAIKLWLLLARRSSEEALLIDENAALAAMTCTSEDRSASLVWNELWPPFERLVSFQEAEMESGDSAV